VSDISIPVVTCVQSTGTYGRFSAEPLDIGFGITLGNAMRRVLLSSLPGAAVTWVKIEGIQHEFSTIPHVREDVLEFLLNVKELRLRSVTHQPGTLFLDVEGEGIVCAADIQSSIDFQVVNPELRLASLDSGEAKLHVEFSVELGRGYVPAISAEGLPVGALPVDAVFSPVRKANFAVEPINPGEERSPERLIIEVWTDGTITPFEAVTQSSDILMKEFAAFRSLEVPSSAEAGAVTGLGIPPDQYKTALSDIGLSTRAHNSLRRAGIMTLGQLIEKTRDGLPPLPGFGDKSQVEVQELLTGLGYPIPEKTKGKSK
jgi:DNA-directed RNA polymerase subunit alpha